LCSLICKVELKDPKTKKSTRKQHPILILIMAVVLPLFFQTHGLAGPLEGILKGLQRAGSEGTGSRLSDDKIADGLKEALEIGASNAVAKVSKLDGYYMNPNIKILLPEKIKNVEGILRGMGYGEKIDAFEQSMNRAAEKAAPDAATYFVDAISRMSIDDARNILNGGENSATLFFEEKTRSSLFEKFKPAIRDSMSSVGVTKYYQDLDSTIRTIPFAGQMSFDLDTYVTDKALDGLFKMVAVEEAKIRKDPAARATDLLREVFGSGN